MEMNCILSSLVSGLGYAFYPRYIVFTMAITNAIESVYKIYEKKFRENRKSLPIIFKMINKIPVAYLMFIACTGLGIQLRIMYPTLVNKFLYKITTYATNGRGDEVGSNFIKFLMGF